MDFLLDDLVVDLTHVMHVRTPAGVKKFGLPIGSVIHAKAGQTIAEAAKELKATLGQPLLPDVPGPAHLSDFDAEGLTPGDSKVLDDYGSPQVYKIVNPYLFHNGDVYDSSIKGYRPATPQEQQIALSTIGALDSAFTKAIPTTHAVKVYRRTGPEMLSKPDMSGLIVVNDGYTSTATEMGKHGYGYESKPVVWEVTLPKGTKALQGNDFENEVLLPREGWFYVHKDETINGERHITATYTPGTQVQPIGPKTQQWKAKDFDQQPVGTTFVTKANTWTKVNSSVWSAPLPVGSGVTTKSNEQMILMAGSFNTPVSGPSYNWEDDLMAYANSDFTSDGTSMNYPTVVVAGDAMPAEEYQPSIKADWREIGEKVFKAQPIGAFFNDNTGTTWVKSTSNDWHKQADGPLTTTTNFGMAGYSGVFGPQGMFPKPKPKPELSKASTSSEQYYEKIPGHIDPAFPILSYEQTASNFPGALTNDQISRVGRYTGDWAGQVNPALRSWAEGFHDDPYDDDAVAVMDSAMQPMKHPAMLFRIMPLSAVLPHDANTYGAQNTFDSLQKLIGTAITDEGYVSTSYDLQGSNIQESNPYFSVRIHAPAGTPAVFAQPYSGFQAEHEVVLARGMHFKVNKVEWNHNPSTYYDIQDNGNMFILDVTADPVEANEHVGQSVEAKASPKMNAMYTVEVLNKAPTGSAFLPTGGEGTYTKTADGAWVYGAYHLEVTPGAHYYGALTLPVPVGLGSGIYSSALLDAAPAGSIWSNSQMAYVKTDDGQWANGTHLFKPSGDNTGTLVPPTSASLDLPEVGKHVITAGTVQPEEFASAPVGTIWHSPGGKVVKQADGSWLITYSTYHTIVAAPSTQVLGNLEKPHTSVETPAPFPIKPPGAVKMLGDLPDPNAALTLAQSIKDLLTPKAGITAGSEIGPHDGSGQIDWMKTDTGWNYRGTDPKTRTWAVKDGKLETITPGVVALWVAREHLLSGNAYDLNDTGTYTSLTKAPDLGVTNLDILQMAKEGAKVTDAHGVVWTKLNTGNWTSAAVGVTKGLPAAALAAKMSV